MNVNIGIYRAEARVRKAKNGYNVVYTIPVVTKECAEDILQSLGKALVPMKEVK